MGRPWQILFWIVVGAMCGLAVSNGAYMLFAPRSYSRSNAWFVLRRQSPLETRKTRWQTLETRIVGAIFTIGGTILFIQFVKIALYSPSF